MIDPVRPRAVRAVEQDHRLGARARDVPGGDPHPVAGSERDVVGAGDPERRGGGDVAARRVRDKAGADRRHEEPLHRRGRDREREELDAPPPPAEQPATADCDRCEAACAAGRPYDVTGRHGVRDRSGNRGRKRRRDKGGTARYEQPGSPHTRGIAPPASVPLRASADRGARNGCLSDGASGPAPSSGPAAASDTRGRGSPPPRPRAWREPAKPARLPSERKAKREGTRAKRACLARSGRSRTSVRRAAAEVASARAVVQACRRVRHARTRLTAAGPRAWREPAQPARLPSERKAKREGTRAKRACLARSGRSRTSVRRAAAEVASARAVVQARRRVRHARTRLTAAGPRAWREPAQPARLPSERKAKREGTRAKRACLA